MMGALARRGPDSAGAAKWPNAVLGHRRLAILDLSEAGHQPMISDDGQIGLVFNGCIYNFLELRRDLEQRGHRFRSRCDTEVLLRGYEEWGIDELTGRLRGMFAFGIWDQRRRTLTLARDRLGVKPLIYSQRDGEIGFASTIGAVRAAGFGESVDPGAVMDLLEFGWVNEDRSIYGGMRKLPPATILEWCDGRTSERRYWTLPTCGESPRMTFEEAVEETERLLVESVRLRLISDVPIGVLLSGGIDSALVCWATRELNANITAFTIRASDDPSDESADAASTARVLGIPHEIVEMPDTDFSLDELTNAYSEPFACESAQAMLWVTRAVKRRATVLLTGDGGDDVFFGYSFFWKAWMAQRLAQRLPAAAAAVWRVIRSACPPHGSGKRVRNFLDYATGGLGDHARAHDGLPYYERRGILGDRLRGRQLPERRLEASLESGRRLLWDVFEYHRRMHFTSEFMPKVDGGTMYYAVEARAPFLDQKIWECAAAMPPEVRFHGRRLKAVLREIVRRRITPEAANREKKGFNVPVRTLLAERWSGMLDRLRENTLLEQEGWVQRGTLLGPLEAALSDKRVPIQLWRLLVLEHWLEKCVAERGLPGDTPWGGILRPSERTNTGQPDRASSASANNAS
jgi:asparagine synthase (glutamine-hydrolysing)